MWDCYVMHLFAVGRREGNGSQQRAALSFGTLHLQFAVERLGTVDHVADADAVSSFFLC